MKTLIVYSSKYGTTETCAKEIANQISCDLKSLDQSNSLSLNDYDHIVIGSSVYIGKMRKAVTTFIEENKGLLKAKKLSLFFCCNETTDYKELVPEVIKHADIYYFGYELKLSQMKFLDKMVTKKVSGATEDVFSIKKGEIKKLISKLEEVPS